MADLEIPTLKKSPFSSVVVVTTMRGADLGHGRRSLRGTDACTSAFLKLARNHSLSLPVT